VLAGAGLVRRNFDVGSLASVSRNDWAYTLGRGVMGFFTEHIGIRGDIRYFRNFQVDELRQGGMSARSAGQRCWD
jgi:hypothetical protein